MLLADVTYEERRSAVLSSSDLPCLQDVATVNITRGCAHGCLYCYTRGYSSYPGEGRVVVYSNLVEKTESELARKRKPVWRVYFSPSCDPFQPLEPVLDATYGVMKLLLKRGISVALLTKGFVSERFLKLFAEHPGLVHAQIGVTTLDAVMARTLEPGTASPAERLSNVRSLRGVDVAVMVRLDPLMPALTDTDENLCALLDRVARAGAKAIALNYLFLRAALRAKLLLGLRDVMASAAQVQDLFSRGTDLAMYRGRHRIRALPADYRKAHYTRIARLAASHGLRTHLCGCKNSDLTTERCHIAGPPPPDTLLSASPEWWPRTACPDEPGSDPAMPRSLARRAEFLTG